MILVGGASGVGKTSVLEKASRKYNVVNVGDILSSMEGFPRDNLRLLPVREQMNWQQKAFRTLDSIKPDVVDTHFAIPTPNGYYPGVPIEYIKKVNGVILIEANEEEVFLRRKRDTTRERLHNFELDVKEEIELNRFFAMTISFLSHSPIKIIHNTEGMLEKAQSELLAVLDNWLGGR